MIHSLGSTDSLSPTYIPFSETAPYPKEPYNTTANIPPLLTMATKVCTAIRTELLQHLVENIIATPGDGLCPHVYRIARMVITPIH